LLSVLAGWGEKVFGAWRRAAVTDLRIADQARLLRRQLAASLEDWPRGPQTPDDVLTWASKYAGNFEATEPALRELVTLRPDASRKIRRAIGTARDAYYAAADLINPTLRPRWVVEDGDARPEPVDPAPLRKALAHVRRCMVA